MKRIFSMIIVFIMCFLMMTSLSFAAPETIGMYESMGVNGVITVTNPDKSYSTTYSKSCTLSGFAQAGANIYIYYYDNQADVYKLYYENGLPLSVTAGASGMFVIPLKLSSGSNNLIIRAEKDNNFQHVSIHINVLSASLFSIKSGLKAFKFN